MTTEQFDTLLKGCVSTASTFFLILPESGGIPDSTDWYAVEFDNGERYSFTRMPGSQCVGTFALNGE